MTDSEKIAEVIIRYVYNKGNSVPVREIQEKFRDKDYAKTTDNMNTILCRFGNFADNGIENYYTLNADGIEFASNGCFSGIKKREEEALFRANLSLILSIIATLIALGGLIVSICK